MTRLGKMLRLYRDRHRLSTRGAAQKIGIPVSTLNRVERSTGGLTADTFLRIGAFLLERADQEPRIRR